MTVYLGLDVSPLRIGIAAVEYRAESMNFRFAETHTFPSNEWVQPSHRAEVIEAWNDKYEINPEVVGMEAVFIGPNKRGSILAAMALGQVEMICDNEWPDADQKVLTAAQWRKLCGIQQGGKQPVMDWALNFAGPNKDVIYKISESQDSADAIAIAYATAIWDNQDDDDES